MKKRLFALVTIVFTSTSGKATDAVDFIRSNSCFAAASKNPVLDYPQLVYEYLDRQLGGKLDVNPQGDGKLITYELPDGKTASLRFTAKMDTVWVDGIFVPEDRRGNGVGTLLYAKMLEFPELRLAASISGLLSSDNLKSFKEAISEGKSPEDAMRETPAFKIRALFGFSIIDPQSDYGHGHLFLVSRRSRLWPYLQ